MANELHSHTASVTGVIRGSRVGVEGSTFVERYHVPVRLRWAVGKIWVLPVYYCMRVAPPLKRKSLLVTVVYCESRIDN
jgi:hypothetical protein